VPDIPAVFDLLQGGLLVKARVSDVTDFTVVVPEHEVGE